MLRATLGVVIGYAAWTVLWLVGNHFLFAEAAAAVSGRQERYEATLPLVALLGQSVVCSLVGGILCGAIARGRAVAAALCLGVALVGTGIGVQASVWSLMPAWYHVAFIVLLLPVTVLGAAFVRRPVLPRAAAA
ncbi:MAG: hypothetical protein KF745_12300 [Phycisphaeraceae bacterium]|nr:hypothetical protein [Phycisphaeraceae bacterium]